MQLDFCPNCFELTNASACPYCGFDILNMETSPVVLSPGTRLADKYKIGRVLGIGGFGVTYIGYDYKNGVRYAIKEYMPHDIAMRDTDGKMRVTSPKFNQVYKKGLDMFLTETNILITLSGTKGIVEAHDFILENNTGYLVMEYLDGTNLKRVLNQRGTLDGEYALNILFETAAALRVVHSKGLLHRDISPENIMILKDGSVKLIDFGASRFFVGEQSRSLSLILKHGFAPVEQYSSNGNQGEWTDIYALAATYYKVVTGRTLPDALTRSTNDTVERLDKHYVSVKPHIGKAIHKALAINYRDRYQNIDQFISALRMPVQPETFSQQITEEPKKVGFFEKYFGKKDKSEPIGDTTTVVHPQNVTPAKNNNQGYVDKSVRSNSPFVRITNGAVTFGVWDIPKDTDVIVGRDSNLCSIIIQGTSISRKHCIVRYDSALSKFIISDCSSNGTFFGNGTRLIKDMQYQANVGSILMLASQEYIMEVGMR